MDKPIIPSKLTIGSQTYTINIVEPNDPRLIQDNCKLSWGRVCYVDNNIYISNELQNDSLIQTLLHEIVHASVNYYLKDEDDLTEHQVDVVATSLIPVYKELITLGMKHAKDEKLKSDIYSGKVIYYNADEAMPNYTFNEDPLNKIIVKGETDA